MNTDTGTSPVVVPVETPSVAAVKTAKGWRQTSSVYGYKRMGSKKKVWGIKWILGDGSLRKEPLDLSKDLAREQLRQRKEALATGKPIDSSTLAEFSARYLKIMQPQIEKITHTTYETYLRLHILPALGNLKLGRVSTGDLQRFTGERLASGAAPDTVRKDLQILSGMFTEAMKLELVVRNPVRFVKKPFVEKKITRWLDEQEEAQLLRKAKSPLKEAIIFAIHTGLREGEQLDLTWADVSLMRKEITVRKTKSHRDRVVPMSETLFKLLDKLPRHETSPLVFFNSKTGERLTMFPNTAWRKALKDAGIKLHLRWHDLRHTFGSRLRQAGVPLETIAELMGHSDLKMTLRYAHIGDADRSNAVRLLDRVVVKSDNRAVLKAKGRKRASKAG